MSRLPAPPPGLDPRLELWARDLVETVQNFVTQTQQNARFKGLPVQLPSATVGQLTASPPVFKPVAGTYVYCTDEASPIKLAEADGTQWLSVWTGALVSV